MKLNNEISGQGGLSIIPSVNTGIRPGMGRPQFICAPASWQNRNHNQSVPNFTRSGAAANPPAAQTVQFPFQGAQRNILPPDYASAAGQGMQDFWAAFQNPSGYGSFSPPTLNATGAQATVPAWEGNVATAANNPSLTGGNVWNPYLNIGASGTNRAYDPAPFWSAWM